VLVGQGQPPGDFVRLQAKPFPATEALEIAADSGTADAQRGRDSRLIAVAEACLTQQLDDLHKSIVCLELPRAVVVAAAASSPPDLVDAQAVCCTLIGEWVVLHLSLHQSEPTNADSGQSRSGPATAPP